ncbi:MAG: ATP-binding protein [Lachnospiraceae bacterium]|nr:ATP-binding protein [Lachnospiraceae bacterium]
MKKNNPFTILFGKKPGCYVSRLAETVRITGDFESDPSPTTVYMITGIRGSGKTVLLTELSEYFENRDWIVIDLVPGSDMISALVSRLATQKDLKDIFKKADLSVNVLGINIAVRNEGPSPEAETQLRTMLDAIKKAGKKLLVTIDEVTSNEHIKSFAAVYQNLIRKEYPIYLIMTGLYDEIYDLQNDKQLTFLYRAPKIVLKPLDTMLMAEEYRKNLELPLSDASEMAKLTKGYSFAFQMLGYLYWDEREKKSLPEILPEYDHALREYAYDKIWSELSATDQEVVCAMAEKETMQVKEIREKLDMTSQKFSVYRDRLERKGVIDTSVYGSISLILPRFQEFVAYKMM